jgi:hypothetical protein
LFAKMLLSNGCVYLLRCIAADVVFEVVTQQLVYKRTINPFINTYSSAVAHIHVIIP